MSNIRMTIFMAALLGMLAHVIAVRTHLRDPTVLDELRTLMSDSRFGTCDSDPSNPQCMAVRDQTEQKIVQQQNRIDVDLLNSRAYMDSLKKELINKVADVKHMNETLYGSIFAPGLIEQYKAILDAITQLQVVLEGADKNLDNEIQVRGDLYNQQMSEIANQQQASADSAQNALLKLQAMNLAAESAQIQGIANSYGHSLVDLSDQAQSVLSDNEKQLSELSEQMTQASQDANDELAVITESASVAKEDARTVAAVGNATFKAAEQNLFQAAQDQLGVFKKFADGLVADGKKTMNQTLTETIQDLSDRIIDLRSRLMDQFNNNNEEILTNITKLKESTAKIIPDAIKQTNDLVDNANAKVATAQANAQTQSKSVQQLVADTSKLMNDLMSQITALSASAKDGQTQARAKLDQDISGVQSSASAQISNINSGTSDELGSLNGQLAQIMKATNSQTMNAQDSYMARLADLRASSAGDSSAALNAIGDANDATSTLGQLNSAKLQQLGDSNTAKISASALMIQGGLQDAADAANEIASQQGASTRQFGLATSQQIADSQQQNNGKVAMLGARVDSQFADVNDSIGKSQKLSQAQLLDLQNAADALSQGSSAVQDKANQVDQNVRQLSAQQLLNFQNLLGSIQTSSSAIGSTSSAAQAQLQSTIASVLNSRLAAMQGTLGSTSQSVLAQLAAASDDAKASADQLTASSTKMNGNFQKTQTDMSALLATLTSASTNVGTNSQNLQALLSSMTNEQVIQLQMKISKLMGDSNNSESALRDYLNAMITNKTDAARTDAQAAFMANQEALTAAINQATGEISSTRDLAARAIATNGMVQTNTTQLFNDFETTEDRIKTLSSMHADVLQNLTINITNWKAGVMEKIADIQSEIAEGSATLPKLAEEKLNNITLLVTMSQNDLKQYLAQFQASLDQAKAIQDHFQDSQSGRIIAAMTGVSQAIVTASVRMASQVAQSNMNANEKAKALTAVLGQMCDSIDKANSQASADDASVVARIHNMSLTANGTIGNMAADINNMMTGLATDKLKKDIALSQSMEDAVTNAGVGINASANSLTLAQQAIHNTVAKAAEGWANNKKNVYTLGGFLFSLSQESQQKLLYILQQLQHGRLSMDQALSLARQTDIAQIKSAQDVVSVLVGAMDSYDEAVEDIFGNSYERLSAASQKISDQLNGTASDLVTLAALLDYNSTVLSNRVAKFGNITNQFMDMAQQNISQLQDYIFDQQAQVTRALAGLSSLMDYSEKDVQLRQQQFSNWIDGLIANEKNVIANKTEQLKDALLGISTTATTVAGTTAGSSTMASATSGTASNVTSGNTTSGTSTSTSTGSSPSTGSSGTGSSSSTDSTGTSSGTSSSSVASSGTTSGSSGVAPPTSSDYIAPIKVPGGDSTVISFLETDNRPVPRVVTANFLKHNMDIVKRELAELEKRADKTHRNRHLRKTTPDQAHLAA